MGGGGGNMGNFGKWCASQYFKTYLVFEKTDPFIYLIIQNVDLFIYCSLIFVPIFCWLLHTYHSQFM